MNIQSAFIIHISIKWKSLFEKINNIIGSNSNIIIHISSILPPEAETLCQAKYFSSFFIRFRSIWLFNFLVASRERQYHNHHGWPGFYYVDNGVQVIYGTSPFNNEICKAYYGSNPPYININWKTGEIENLDFNLTHFCLQEMVKQSFELYRKQSCDLLSNNINKNRKKYHRKCMFCLRRKAHIDQCAYCLKPNPTHHCQSMEWVCECKHYYCDIDCYNKDWKSHQKHHPCS